MLTVGNGTTEPKNVEGMQLNSFMAYYCAMLGARDALEIKP